jgi:release factor glutamine methyltransferase
VKGGGRKAAQVSVAQALREATQRLSQTSDTARLDAELLMAHALGKTRSQILLGFMEDPVPEGFEALIARRARHEPLAYIIGEQEFYGRPLRVTRDTLIPRADSEILVETALELLKDRPGARIIDLGTGSGALILSILAERPDLCGVGIDKSAAAIRVARENAVQLGLAQRVTFLERGWFASPGPSAPSWTTGLDRYDLVIANPPYVEVAAALQPSVHAFEPHAALFAGPEGLDDYRVLIPTIRDIMGEDAMAVLEIGASQAASVAEMARHAGFSVEVRPDLAQRPRAVILS